MRRSQIYEGLVSIANAIESSGAAAHIDALARKPDSSFPPERLLEVFQKITIAASHFKITEHELLTRFNLESFASADFWGQIISGDTDSIRSIAVPLSQHWSNFQYNKSLVLGLLDVSEESIAQRVTSRERFEETHLVLMLPENLDLPTTPIRIKMLMGAIEGLFEVTRKLRNEKSNDIHVVLCDSGSDKEFWFNATKDTIREIRDTLSVLLDKLLFYRESRTEKRLELAIKSIPIFLEIQARRNELGKANALALELLAFESIRQFVGSKAVFPQHLIGNDEQLLLSQDYIDEIRHPSDIPITDSSSKI